MNRFSKGKFSNKRASCTHLRLQSWLNKFTEENRFPFSYSPQIAQVGRFL